VLGVVSGLAAGVLSYAHARNTGEVTTLVGVNFVAGVTAVVLGVRSLMVAGHSGPRQESREPATRRKVELRIAPALGGGRTFGLALAARF
jgi:hypothetical protein